jgi:hypothetical protein
MVVDPNVADYIVLLVKIVKTKIERIIWMIRFHPIITTSPIFRWWMMRKYMRTVEELSQELTQKKKSDV